MAKEKNENTTDHNFYEMALDYMIKYDELIPVERFLENGGEINKGSHYHQLHNDQCSFLLQCVVVSEVNGSKFKVTEVENTDGKTNTTSYSGVRKYGKAKDSRPTLFTYKSKNIELFNRRAEQMQTLQKLANNSRLGIRGELSIDTLYYVLSSNVQELVKNEHLFKEKKRKGGLLSWLFKN